MADYFGPNQSRISKRTTVRSYAIVGGILFAFFAGWYLGSDRMLGANANGGDRPVKNIGLVSDAYTGETDFQLFWDVWNDIKSNYVEQPVSDQELLYGAMQGLISSLDDPYSEFFEPETAAAFNQELSGSFSGIGVEVGIKNDALVVIAPLDGSPGAKAGLKPGDIILAIDGEETFDFTLDRAVSMIRGEEGTPVTLTVLSKNAEAAKDVTIIRAKIKHTGLRWEYLSDNIVHVKLVSFDQDAENLLNQLVRELEQRGNVQGIVLDLRNNPGGFLDMAIEVASEWIEDGVILRERDNNGEERQHHARGRARLVGYETVVLVNEGSASASEIVAGALQDYGLAELVGVTTFGKGSVQKYESLEDGSAFRLTVARWFTPMERAINEVGVEPDVVIELTEEDFNNDRDPQLDKALEILRNQ